jgi:trimeric autotransporter adhesin
LKGIAVIAAGTAHGRWEYSLDDGGHWQNMASPVPPSETSALLLPITPQSRVRFLPAANFHGSAQLWYRAWDQTQGTIGGRLATGSNKGANKSLSMAVEGAAIAVTSANDRPSLTLSGSLGYQRNAPAIVLAPNALVIDPDSPNFGGGSLRVWITSGGGTNNTLAIGSGFTVDSSGNVKQGTLIIGKRLSNGVGTNELKIQFNSNATVARVQALVRSITYRNAGGSAGQRTIAFTVSDGDGGLSAVRTKTVNVT